MLKKDQSWKNLARRVKYGKYSRIDWKRLENKLILQKLRKANNRAVKIYKNLKFE